MWECRAGVRAGCLGVLGRAACRELPVGSRLALAQMLLDATVSLLHLAPLPLPPAWHGRVAGGRLGSESSWSYGEVVEAEGFVAHVSTQAVGAGVGVEEMVGGPRVDCGTGGERHTELHRVLLTFWRLCVQREEGEREGGWGVADGDNAGKNWGLEEGVEVEMMGAGEEDGGSGLRDGDPGGGGGRAFSLSGFGAQAARTMLRVRGLEGVCYCVYVGKSVSTTCVVKCGRLHQASEYHIPSFFFLLPSSVFRIFFYCVCPRTRAAAPARWRRLPACRRYEVKDGVRRESRAEQSGAEQREASEASKEVERGTEAWTGWQGR